MQFSQELADFYAHAKRLVEADLIAPEHLVAAVQLQLPTDIQVSTQDKLDTMVGAGVIMKSGAKYFHPVKELAH